LSLDCRGIDGNRTGLPAIREQYCWGRGRRCAFILHTDGCRFDHGEVAARISLVLARRRRRHWPRALRQCGLFPVLRIRRLAFALRGSTGEVPDAARRYGTLSGPRGFTIISQTGVKKMNLTNRRDFEPADRDPAVMWDWPTAAAVLVIVVIAGLMVGL
jgi:hypothetical protein